MGGDDLDAALAAVEKRIQIPGHFPEIFAQRRRLRVKGGEQQTPVAVQLRDWREPPALPLQFAVIGFFEVRDPDQSPVIAIRPAVISAGECRGIAAIGTTQAVAAVPANVQKGAYLALGIAHHQHRIFAHISCEEVARPRDLALVAQKQPTPGEYPLQLLLVDLRLYKDPAANKSPVWYRPDQRYLSPWDTSRGSDAGYMDDASYELISVPGNALRS